ncbi:MAG: glycoside hydrolase family 2, partial [Clostridia bacterium]|nr:glycoside hydrolase family 2 [Clostridia bacterium]
MNYLKSRFTDIDENMPLAEYPRPQLERDSYICLNGKWLYSICSSESEPSVFDGTITVPFSPETPLSGVMKTLSPDNYLWYKRSFTLPASFMNDRLVIHFGAVDRHAAVFVNGKLAVTHSGGYTPFSADITEL